MLDNNPVAARIVVFFVGLLFAAAGVLLLFNAARLQRECTLSVTGIMIRYEETTRRDNDGKRTRNYYPVFAYEVDGQSFIERYGEGSSRRPYANGDSVALKCNPNNPSEFVIEGKEAPSLFLYVIACVGVLLMIVAILPGRLELVQIQ